MDKSLVLNMKLMLKEKKITLHFSIHPKERWASTKLFIHSCYMHVAFSPEQTG